MKSGAVLLILESPLPRILPARPEEHGHSAMEATDTVIVSWCLVPASRAMTATRFCILYCPDKYRDSPVRLGLKPVVPYHPYSTFDFVRYTRI